MADTGDETSGQSAQGRDEVARRRRWLLAAVIATAMVAVAVWLGFALTGPDSYSSDHHGSPAETGDDRIVPSGRRYSDEELGIEELFEELIVPRYARFRSPQDASDYNSAKERYLLEEAVGHERERLYFEHNLTSVYWRAHDELPAELGSGGTLDRAYEETMDQCAAAAGWPGVTLYGVSQSDVDAFGEQFGLTLDDFLDLRHECAKEAASYPTLDPAVRDALLDRLREHYRAAVHEFLRENPHLEIPLVDHPGAPRPFEERWIEICLKTPDPVACAAEQRVELPAE